MTIYVIEFLSEGRWVPNSQPYFTKEDADKALPAKARGSRWEHRVGIYHSHSVGALKERPIENLSFSVIDRLTGNLPDIRKIAIEERWANGLVYRDMGGFSVTQDGVLILMDERGNAAVCPHDRFKVIFKFKAQTGGAL